MKPLEDCDWFSNEFEKEQLEKCRALLREILRRPAPEPARKPSEPDDPDAGSAICQVSK
jgi:hypothetical protein